VNLRACELRFAVTYDAGHMPERSPDQTPASVPNLLLSCLARPLVAGFSLFVLLLGRQGREYLGLL